MFFRKLCFVLFRYISFKKNYKNVKSDIEQIKNYLSSNFKCRHIKPVFKNAWRFYDNSICLFFSSYVGKERYLLKIGCNYLQLKNEIKSYQYLNSYEIPFIVKSKFYSTFDVLRKNGSYDILAIPYLKGELLDNLNKIKKRLTNKIIEELNSLLDFLLAIRFAHNDIKGDNLLLVNDHIFVIDFGYAKWLEEATLNDFKKDKDSIEVIIKSLNI